MTKKIKVAIVGVGNCASSLIQGIEYYSNHEDDTIGIMHDVIGWYSIKDIEPVLWIDVNINKIWKKLSEAIFQYPNCTKVFYNEVQNSSTVIAWPLLDWISDRMKQRVPIHNIEKDINEWEQYVIESLINNNVDILISYLPVWSKDASRFYANCALWAKVSYINAMPEFISSDKSRSEKFKKIWIPCAWDDIKSQVWATIIHRCLVDLINKRWQVIDGTYQLNIWGNTDFENMLDEERLTSKRISKTEAVKSLIKDYDLKTKIWPSDYVDHLNDNKICYINIEWRQFWNIPFSIDLKLSVQDSPNSAWVMVDVIRLLQTAKDNNLSGYQDFSCYFFKHPMFQYTDDVCFQLVEDFIQKYK